MIKITNYTKNTVIFYNNNSFFELRSNETIKINKETLNGDFEFHFSYFGFKEMQKKLDCSIEQGGLRKRIYLKYENQLHIPIETIIDIGKLSELTLESEEVNLRKLLLFKTVHLKRIICKCKSSEKKIDYGFLNEKDKLLFLNSMRLGTAITFPLAILAILMILVELFSNDTIISKIIIILFLIGFTELAFEDFYYTLVARKWRISSRGRQGDGSAFR